MDCLVLINPKYRHIGAKKKYITESIGCAGRFLDNIANNVERFSEVD